MSEPTWDDLETWGKRAVTWGVGYHRSKRDLPVRAQVAPGDIAAQLPKAPPENGEAMEAIFDDFEKIIMPGMTHWQHPRFFAYFCTNATPPSVVADYLIATMSAQCMLWQTSPAATELETRVLDWLRQALGLPDGFHGVIQGTASEATLAAVLTMRERTLGWAGNEAGLPGQHPLRIYTTDQVHTSIDRAIWIAGIGQENLIRIPTSGPLKSMDTVALNTAIETDRAAGLLPAGIITCVGGTSTGACDIVSDVAVVAKRQNLFLHVDAAWAGNAMLCPELRDLWAGSELADSIVFNPYKWIGGQFDGSVHFVRSPEDLTRTLAYHPEYLKTHGADGFINYSEWSVPLGRRFRALKLWFLIRAYGLDGLRNRIRNHIAWAETLCEKIRADYRFEIVTDPILSLFSFRATGLDDAGQLDFVERINSDGRIYLTQTNVDGKIAIRVQVSQFDTTKADVMLIHDVIGELL